MQYLHPISTINRIQQAVLLVLSNSKPMTQDQLKTAVRQTQRKRVKPETGEDWDKQFDLAIAGLFIRHQISRHDTRIGTVIP